MVSTRQMSIGNSGTTEGSEHAENGPAKYTRNSTAAAHSSHQGQCSKSTTNAPAKLHFLDLPQEIIEKIFSYLTYKNICQLRFVCTRIDRICGHILNTTFQRLQHQLLDRFHEIKRKMPRRESARRNHHLACESDIIETLHMRLTLLQMSLGKHIERKHCCFFPGEILDEVLHILHYIKVTPKLARPYKVTDELFDLSTMAMEYFKEKIEPDLPEIAYFNTDFLDFAGSYPSTSKKNYLLDSFSIDMDEAKDADSPPHDASNAEASPEGVPQSNIVLRKGIRKIKQGMKRYNSQLTILRQDVRSCRQKAAEQQKLMSEQQKQLAEQQKQILEYATRMDENDKKNEEISRKFSTLLQELNKCKTELQYWRSKSPATPLFCTSCGNAVLPHPEELEALVNQGVNPLGLEPISDFEPIPGSSNSEEAALEVEAAAEPCKSTKRKLEDNTPTRASTSKKSRRILKGRTNKRSKI
ncbi:F-box only protein 28 [Tribolium castaneum]|uniref:F-box only protein 28-like Protein n=1 Tax=Tribolium castaneum TaxID=7070 RepID=D6W986_TRICA|nr:PREDICTED: F-box only protein 28 [Tribolium castaneum]XP_967057.1 PREDICTED: F-box only protein 28 [Tribolium castaneum]EEZ98462.1 F-box only protein 28-like Protein [Tribolium castaneum]|eukprot:XP_008195292.1 PREDICTED: F-box only protein 28 [Tribolium castaneum]